VNEGDVRILREITPRASPLAGGADDLGYKNVVFNPNKAVDVWWICPADCRRSGFRGSFGGLVRGENGIS